MANRLRGKDKTERLICRAEKKSAKISFAVFQMFK